MKHLRRYAGSMFPGPNTGDPGHPIIHDTERHSRPGPPAPQLLLAHLFPEVRGTRKHYQMAWRGLLRY